MFNNKHGRSSFTTLGMHRVGGDNWNARTFEEGSVRHAGRAVGFSFERLMAACCVSMAVQVMCSLSSL